MIHSILNSMPLFFGNIRGTQLLIIVLVILLLFGGKKIPELMRGVGKGINSFKQGLKETQDEIKKGIDEEPGADNKNK